MKKIILLTLSFLFLGFKYVHAIPSTSTIINIRDQQGRAPTNYCSDQILRASHTAVVSTNIQISTMPAKLGTIVVNTPGTSSKLEVYDARLDTSSLTAQTMIANIDTTSKISLIYNISTSSGILAVNNGSPPADVTIGYLNNLP